jgi:ribosomal protein S18 acetylase RimI-like enzyme
MGQDVSMYPKFHFIVIPALPATVYYEVTASNLVSNNMNEVVANILNQVPAQLKNECFPEGNITIEDSFKQYSFLILDERYSFVAFATYDTRTINNQLHYVVWNVCTAKKFRGQKIIGKLLLFSIEYMKNLGNQNIEFVSLYVLKNNTPAQKVYGALGFRDDESYKNETWHRGTRALNWIPPELSSEARQPLSSTEQNLLQVQPIDIDTESTLRDHFRREYLEALRKFIGMDSVSDLINRAKTLSEIRTKYSELSPSIMDEVISTITIADQLFQAGYEIKEPDQPAEFEEKDIDEIEARFQDEYYKVLEKLYNGLGNPKITLDKYVKLKNEVEHVEEKYVAQLERDEMRTLINKIIADLSSNLKYEKNWGRIADSQIIFEQELMNIERELTGSHKLDISLLATTRAHAITTTFIGGPERHLIGMAYLAGKHKDTCCVYYPKRGVRDNKYESIMMFIRCDGKGTWTINEPPNLWKQIEACKKPFFLVLLGIMHANGTEGHQNLLIYDTRAKVIERFEPYGITANLPSCGKSEKIDIVIKKWLDNVGKNIIYVSPVDYCPNMAIFQEVEEKEPNRLPIDPEGFCVAWNLWYADVRLGAPESSRKDTIKRSSEFLKSGELRTFIRNYANYIERILATVNAIIIFSSSSVPVQEWVIGHWYELSQLVK